MKTGNVPRRFVTRLNSLIFVGVFMILAAVLAVPFYSARSSSLPNGPSQASAPSGAPTSEIGSLKASIRPWSSTFRSLLPMAAETITTFAADCTTPRTAFFLGETVCAQTDNVSESNRFVNWCVSCPTIDFGGAGVTDINPLAQPQNFLYTPTVTGTWKATIADSTDSSIIPAVFTVSVAPPQTELMATYEAPACVVPKTVFSLGETVCARAIGLTGFRFAWADPAGFNEQRTAITTDPQTDTFPLPATDQSVINGVTVDNRGEWRVNAITSRGSLKTSAFFTVKNPTSAATDLSINKTFVSDSATSGNPVQFAITITNNGPNDAAIVHFQDTNFTNATFSSVAQTSGPAFTCMGGSADCSITSLPKGAVAQFLVTLTAGVAGGNLENTATVGSNTTELNSEDNSFTAATITVESGGPPSTCSLDCPNNIITSANTTQGTQQGAIVTLPNVEAFGTCGPVTLSPASGSFFPVGIPTVVTASASGGGTCSFTVTVIVTAAPTISCPANITVAALPGQATAFVPDPNSNTSSVGSPTTTGSNVTLEGVRSDQEELISAYPVGVTNILWTATDDGGRTVSCTQKIIVTSPEAPTISCPSDKTFTAASGACTVAANAGQIGTPTTGGTNVTVTSERSDNQALTDPFPAGDTSITWTATNNIGSASCTQNIHVNAVDTSPPTLTVPPDVSVTTSTCSALLDDELGVATATDTCTSSVNIKRTGVPLTPFPGGPIACPTIANPARRCIENFNFPVGTTDVTYTATDAAGNVATGVQHVTVHELTPPTFTFAPGNLTVNTGPGATSCSSFVGDATLGTATIFDNCDTTVIRTGVPAGNIFPVGPTTITYTAKADLSVHVTQIVTVVDDTLPVVTAPGPVTLLTGAGATSCGVTVTNLNGTFGTGSATDNCAGVGPVTRSGVPAGGVFPVGQTTLTYSATDAHGNTASANQIVTVVDNTLPVVTAPGPVTLLTGAGATSCGVTVSNLNTTFGTGSATDNCPGVGPVTRGGVPAGNFFPVGQTTLTYSTTDAHGNTGSANQLVTVVDNTPPAISCQSDIVADFNPAVNGAVVTYTAPVGTDNCASNTTQIAGLPSGSTFPTGTTTNTFKVTDASGNTAQCSFKVTVALTSIIGLDSVSISGASYIDSYNSALGYPASKSSLANVLSNGTITLAGSAKVWGNVRSTRVGVNMSGASQVTGNATAGTTVSLSGSATVGGIKTNNSLAPVMTLPSVAACSPFSSNSGISGTYTYNAGTGDLTLSGVNIATLANGNYCFHNVSVGGSAQLKVNGLVVIKMTGTLNTSGASSMPNTTAIPSNLRILSSYSGSNGVSFGASSNVHLVIYAPKTDVNISGATPLFGTIAGKTLTVSGSGVLHYDTQLKTIWPAVWALLP